MENSDIEISEKSKIVPPKVPSAKDTKGLKTEENDLKNKSYSKTVKVLDLSRHCDAQQNFEYFKTLQEIFDKVLFKTRAPTTNKDRVKYAIPNNRVGAPIIEKSLYVGNNNFGANGSGQINLQSWTHDFSTWTAYLKPADKYLRMRILDEEASTLFTNASNTKEQQVTDGVRNTRARPAYVLGDWGSMLTTEIDTAYRHVNTHAIAELMYNNYVETSPKEKLYIVNFNTLRDYLNTHVNTMPVPNDTLCLNLVPGSSDAELGKLALLNEEVIVDFASSVKNNGYYGDLDCRIVDKLSVSSMDDYVAHCITRTFNSKDLDIAFFVNAFPFRPNEFASAKIIQLDTYRNSIQDQCIQFFGIPNNCEPHIPTSGAAKAEFIFDFRYAKTAFTNLANMCLGFSGDVDPYSTTGMVAKASEVADRTYQFWSFLEQHNDAAAVKTLWVPWEFLIHNGAEIELEKEDYVTSISGRLVNKNWKFSRSFVFVDVNKWNAQTVVGRDYFIPNSTSPILTVYVGSGLDGPNYDLCRCATLRRYSSTSKTMSLDWDADARIMYVPTQRGVNDNYVYEEDLF